MRTYKQSGFTLIEMLVVVAVIGILSSVLLTALGPARDKAKDSRITQEVNQVRSIAETLYDGDYDALPDLPGNFIGNEDLEALVNDIRMQGGELNIIKSSRSGAREYSAYSKLNTKVGVEPDLLTQYYCVDSRGRSVFTTTEPTEARCP
jgi:prepilin-type N-terminal cleavage/methylation domain-containing protein